MTCVGSDLGRMLPELLGPRKLDSIQGLGSIATTLERSVGPCPGMLPPLYCFPQLGVREAPERSGAWDGRAAQPSRGRPTFFRASSTCGMS